jgi:hypothetical protein
LKYNNNVVLCFGDTHFPYAVKGWYEFLKAQKDLYNPDRVVCMGDLLDLYSVSSYPKDLSHPDTWSSELKKGRKDIAKLSYLFPNMEVLSSNHAERLYKKSVVAGIPRESIVPYREMIGAPSTWRFHDRLRIRSEKYKSHWIFAHTVDGGALSAAKQLGRSVAIGHHHTRFSASGFNNGTDMIYGVDVGCLISDEVSPFAYNKTQLGRPIRGCCVILDGVPRLIPMD